MVTSPYLDLTTAFNQDRLRAILSSGQAVVLYRLAVMSKDGDWIVREDQEALAHILGVLEDRGARYRFGAPLDLRWLRGGWSSHFEIRGEGNLRLRADFVSRPPRLSAEDLEELWRNPVELEVPVVGLEHLAELKKTNREKDYAVLGELARLMPNPRAQLLYSRSGRDLLELASRHPELVAELRPTRTLLALIPEGRDAVERALDEERRVLMRANEARLHLYEREASAWASGWTELQRTIAEQPLRQAHAVLVDAASRSLPETPLANAGGAHS